MHRLEDNAIAVSDDSESFVDYQTRMVTAAKEIARLAQDMVSVMFICNLPYGGTLEYMNKVKWKDMFEKYSLEYYEIILMPRM